MKVCKANKKDWDSFVKKSPQDNVFCKIWFLDCYNQDYQTYFVKLNSAVCLGVVIIKNKDSFVYQGLLFNRSLDISPIHRGTSIKLKLADFLIKHLVSKNKKIFLSLHYSIKDIRAFQWFNYHKSKKYKFKVDIKYTGLIDLGLYKNFSNYVMSIRKVRRYEYRQAIKQKLYIEQSDDIEKLNYLHKLTFERQGLKRDSSLEKKLLNIARDALKNGFGKINICMNSNNRVISSTLFLYDNSCSYYMFAANHPDYRKLYGGTFLFLENIKYCFKKKIFRIDVCGINSPNRGDFKTSFNAKPTPYYELIWQNNEC